MGRTELEVKETETRLRTLQREVDRELRRESKQARRTERRAGRSAGELVLWALGGILVLGLAMRLIQFVVPLLVLVLIGAGVWWLVTALLRRSSK